MPLTDYVRDVCEGDDVQTALDDLAARTPANTPDRRRYALLHSSAFALYAPLQTRSYVDLKAWPGWNLPELQAVDCDALVGAGVSSKLDGVRLTVHSTTTARSGLVIHEADHEVMWFLGYLTHFGGPEYAHKGISVTNGGRAYLESCTVWLQQGSGQSALLYASGPGSKITVANSMVYRSAGTGEGVLCWADDGAVIDLQICRYDTGGRLLAQETNGGTVKLRGCVDVST